MCMEEVCQGQKQGLAVDCACLQPHLHRIRLFKVPTGLPGAAGPSLSCFKVQAFLMLMLCWLLPALVLRRLEQHVSCAAYAL